MISTNELGSMSLEIIFKKRVSDQMCNNNSFHVCIEAASCLIQKCFQSFKYKFYSSSGSY